MPKTKQPSRPKLSHSLLGNFLREDKSVEMLEKEYHSLNDNWRKRIISEVWLSNDITQIIDAQIRDKETLNRTESRIEEIGVEITSAKIAEAKHPIKSMQRALSEEYPWPIQVLVRPLELLLRILLDILEKCARFVVFFPNLITRFLIEMPVLALINFITDNGFLDQYIDASTKVYWPTDKAIPMYDPEGGDEQALLFRAKKKLSYFQNEASKAEFFLSTDVEKEFAEIRENSNEKFRLALAAVFVYLTTMPSGALAKLRWPICAVLLIALSLILIAQRVVRELIDSAVLAVLMVTKIIRFPVLVVLNTPLFLYNLPKNLREAWENRATLVQDFKTMLFENRFALPSNVLLTLSAVGVAAVIFGINPLILGIVAAASSVSTLFLSQQSLTIGNPKLRLALSVLFFLAAAALVFFAFGGTWFPSIADFIPSLPHLVIPFSIPAQIGIAAAGTWFMVYLPTLFTAMVNWATDFPGEKTGESQENVEFKKQVQETIEEIVNDYNKEFQQQAQNDKENFSSVFTKDADNLRYTKEDAEIADKTNRILVVVKPGCDFEGDAQQEQISCKAGEYIWLNPPDDEQDWGVGEKKNCKLNELKEGCFPLSYVDVLYTPSTVHVSNNKLGGSY